MSFYCPTTDKFFCTDSFVNDLYSLLNTALFLEGWGVVEGLMLVLFSKLNRSSRFSCTESISSRMYKVLLLLKNDS